MNNPLVGIVMGSKSDLPVMQKTLDMLDEFGIAYDMRILSAHRTPAAVEEFSRAARDRGIRVMIAAAGGAAHLAGAVAAQTTLPVIGVPIRAVFSVSGGLDAVLSTVQMPSGVPVATVALDGSKNAAVLAAQIIGSSDSVIADKLKQFKADMASAILNA